MEKLKDEYQDYVFLLGNQFVNKLSENLSLDDRFDTEGELSQINETSIGVMSDLSHLVIKESRDYRQSPALNKGVPPLFCICNFQDS